MAPYVFVRNHIVWLYLYQVLFNFFDIVFVRCCLGCGQDKISVHSSLLDCESAVASIKMEDVCGDAILKQYLAESHPVVFDLLVNFYI